MNMLARGPLLAALLMIPHSASAKLSPELQTDVFSKQEMIDRLDALSRSCNYDSEQRVAAADRLMELIVRRIDRLDSGQYMIERSIWDAGDLLFKLTISFQINKLTPAQCQRGVMIIRGKLLGMPRP